MSKWKQNKAIAGSPQESQNTAFISSSCILASFIAWHIFFQLQFSKLFLSRSNFFELQHLRRCFNSSSSPQQANGHCPWRLFIWNWCFCLGQWPQECAVKEPEAFSIFAWLLRTGEEAFAKQFLVVTNCSVMQNGLLLNICCVLFWSGL